MESAGLRMGRSPLFHSSRPKHTQKAVFLLLTLDVSNNEVYRARKFTPPKVSVMRSQPNDSAQTAAPAEPELRALMGVFALYHFIEANLGKAALCEHLPHTERRIVVWLDHPKRLGTLARELNVLPSTMTSAADQLEALGLVERTRDPADRRAGLLGLTERGLQTRKEMVSLAQELLRDMLHLTEDELARFADISTKIHSNVQKLTSC